METDDVEDINLSNCIHENQSAVNSLILDYYKKFGRKRDLEQFFSLSTAQSDIRDPSSLFWRRMKSYTDSSDSGDNKKSGESSTELCRISIQCSIPETSGSQHISKVKSDSESPPIISEEVQDPPRNSDDESIKSDDAPSEKYMDGTLDTSINKPHSPTSSVTSQRKLEWDSLADVGYANESDRKNSVSSLSTLERLALQQQYSYNDTKQTSDLGIPTAQSTPNEVIESKTKNKKGLIKTTKIRERDIDSVRLTVPQNLDGNSKSINVNLTKHITFNVEKDGGFTVENKTRNVSVSPEKVSVQTEVTPHPKIDKEIQTSLTKSKDNSSNSNEAKALPQNIKRYPVLISLNTLKKKSRKKKFRKYQRSKSKRKIIADKENIPHERSGEQVSEAESFEYMPGHIYNENKMKSTQCNVGNTTGNKSSLESSAGLTTDSSKATKQSFNRDLERSVDVLRAALENKYESSHLKKKLIKEIVQRLIKTRYKNEESTSDFLSGLSIEDKKLNSCDHTITSSSDPNETDKKTKASIPKKSILRVDKFNSNIIASTSQSVPNLPYVANSEKPIILQTSKQIDISCTDSDVSGKNKNASWSHTDKTSSEELYKKYLEAVKREEIYKKHLKEKEIFLKQKLVCSDDAVNIKKKSDMNVQNRLKDLVKDLTRNNYNDGSGDASKLEGGSSSNFNNERHNCIKKQRSHSVFTLSSGNSEHISKYSNCKNKQAKEANTGCSNNEKHYCCCPYHTSKIGVTDSSVQVDLNKETNLCAHRGLTSKSPECISAENPVNPKSHKITSPKTITQILSEYPRDDIKYVCLCADDMVSREVSEKVLIYKCSRLPIKDVKCGETEPKTSNFASAQCSSNLTSPRRRLSTFKDEDCKQKCLVIKDSNSSNDRTSKSSQTNLNLPLLLRSKSSEQSTSSSSSDTKHYIPRKTDNSVDLLGSNKRKPSMYIHEATRSIQTDMSINPKISDPSLSDINIVNEKDCVKLISEQFKEISRPSSDTKFDSNFERNKFPVNSIIINSAESELRKRNLMRNVSTDTIAPILKLDKEIQSNPNDGIPNITTQVQSVLDDNNFTIPIKGTNMTLKVSVGSGSNTASIETKNMRCCFGNTDEDIVSKFPKDNYLITENMVQNKNIFEGTSKTECAFKNIDTRGNDAIKTKNIESLCGTIEKGFISTYGEDNSENMVYKNFLQQKNVLEDKSKTEFMSQGTDTDGNDAIESKNDKGFSGTIEKRFVSKCGEDNSVVSNNFKLNKNPLDAKSKAEFKSQGTEPIKNDAIENSTSISEECSKGVQSNSNHIFTDLYDKVKKSYCGDKNIKSTSIDARSKDYSNLPAKTANMNSCLTDNCRYNTYPKNDRNNIQKPLIRSNTDTGKMEKTCHVTFHQQINKNSTKESHKPVRSPKELETFSTNVESVEKANSCCSDKSSKSSNNNMKSNIDSDSDEQLKLKLSNSETDSDCKMNGATDPLLDMIQDITKRYTKKDIDKTKKKKCLKEIISVLNYLLNTEDSTDYDKNKASCSSTCDEVYEAIEKSPKNKVRDDVSTKTLVDKGVQLSAKKSKSHKISTESSDLPISTDLPSTSSDSATCKVLNKIKRECEKYHQKRCKSHSGGKKCEVSSSTSVSCNQCRRVHYCSCKGHKCKSHRVKTAEKTQRKCVAYNLIIQTSDSIVSEEVSCNTKRQLQNIIVKVPTKRKVENVPFKEMASKIEKDLPCYSPRGGTKCCRSRSLPNDSEISSTDDVVKKAQVYSVREYLEKNRPDFVEKCSERQHCLRMIKETRPGDDGTPRMNMIVVHTPNCANSCMESCDMCCRGMTMNNCHACINPFRNMHCIQNEVTRIATERATKRNMLSLQMARSHSLNKLSENELKHFAKQLGAELRRKMVAPKFISEREMKKHSEKIYKSLPEVVRKKEEIKKENIKKTNLLMASIFKKNLQKNTLRGTVNLSNYNTVIKI